METQDAVKQAQFSILAKRAAFAYMLWNSVGVFGAHNFYLGRKRNATLQLITLILVAAALGAGVALFIVEGVEVPMDIVNDPNMASEMVTEILDDQGLLAGIALGAILVGGLLMLLLVIWLILDGFATQGRVSRFNRRLLDRLVDHPEQRQLALFNSRVKNVGLAYILLLLLGFLGGHCFYLRRRGAGMLHIVFILAPPINLAWLFVELFLVHKWVARHNATLMEETFGADLLA